jgi:hypothetical protein
MPLQGVWRRGGGRAFMAWPGFHGVAGLSWRGRAFMAWPGFHGRAFMAGLSWPGFHGGAWRNGQEGEGTLAVPRRGPAPSLQAEAASLREENRAHRPQGVPKVEHTPAGSTSLRRYGLIRQFYSTGPSTERLHFGTKEDAKGGEQRTRRIDRPLRRMRKRPLVPCSGAQSNTQS